MAFSFRRFTLGVVLSNLASGVLFAVLPLLVLDENSGPLLATLIVVAPLLAQTFASFLWGALSDYLGRRTSVLVVGALGAAALYLTFPFVSPVTLLLLRTAQAALLATSTLVYTLSSEGTKGSVGQRIGGTMMWSNVGSLIGLLIVFPLLGLKTLDGTLGWELIGVLSASTALSAWALSSAGDLPRVSASLSVQDLFKFRERSKVLSLSAAVFPLSLGNYIAYTTLPVFIYGSLGRNGFFGYPMSDIEQLGIYSIVTTAIAVPLCYWVGVRIEGQRWRLHALVVAPVIYTVLWLTYGLSTGAASAYLIFFVLWAIPVYPLLGLAATRELASVTSSEERGRGIGLWNTVYMLGGLIGGTVAGIELEDGVPYGAVFLLGGLLAAVGAIATAAVLKKSWRF